MLKKALKDRRIVLFAKSEVHAQLLAPALRELLHRGANAVLFARRHKRQRSQAAEWLDQQELPFQEIKSMVWNLRSNDIVVSCGHSRSIDTYKKIRIGHQIVVVALNEGCRFAKVGKYDMADVFLGFGPSAHDVPVSKVYEVGSTVIEDLLKLQRTGGRLDSVIINLKGTRRVRKSFDNDIWLNEVVKAIKGVGMRPLVSIHPNHVLHKQRPEGLDVSSEPIGDLMLDCPALVTRASTLIHQGLAIGCQPFFFTESLDDAYEFADPMESYPIVKPGELAQALGDWRAGRLQFDPKPFQEAHVSIDPNRTAVQRIADALEEIREN